MSDREINEVVFIVERLQPAFGMERVTSDLVAEISASLPNSVIAISGSSEDRGNVPDAVILGKPRTRFKWPAHVGRIAWMRHRLKGKTVILVGVWVAVPWLLFRGTASRVIVWEHSISEEKISSSRTLRVLERFARRLYERADLIVAVSEPLAADLNKWGGSTPIMTIPNLCPGASGGPVGNREDESSDAGAPRISRVAVIGSLTATKRQRMALEILKNFPNVVVDIVGDGPLRSDLEDYASELGMSNRTKFHGYVDSSQVRNILSTSDALLHCAHGETFGMVYFEAAAAGVPVLAYRDRVSAWLIPYYVPGQLFSNPQEAPKALLSVMETSESEKSAASTRRASDFSASEICAKWIEAIDVGRDWDSWL